MSGIYIKGVEPPANCGRCSEKIDPENRRCLVDGHIFEETLGKLTNRRDANCPIFSVRPHGRLIDADTLFKAIGTDERFSVLEAMYIQSLISAATTIIPAKEDAP